MVCDNDGDDSVCWCHDGDTYPHTHMSDDSYITWYFIGNRIEDGKQALEPFQTYT